MATSSTSSSTAAKDLAAQLAASESTIIYVDVSGLNDAGAAALLKATPALHVERDQVRDQWAVRLATDDEVAAASS